MCDWLAAGRVSTKTKVLASIEGLGRIVASID